MDFKVCSKCKESKPVDQFRKEVKMRDGRGSQCNTCVAASKREYYKNRKNGNSRIRLEEKQRLAAEKANITHKVCTKCKVEKPVSEFNSEGKNRPGKYKPQCKECTQKYYTTKDKFHKENGGNPTRKEWFKKNRDRLKDGFLRRTYGISIEEYKTMFNNQCGKCAICGKEETRLNKDGTKLDLSVDHCHKTGKVRKLLCSTCNTTLGKVEEDIDRLSKLAAYIKEHRD